MSKKNKATADAVEILRRRHYAERPSRLAELAEARAEDELSRKIHELREKAGLTQGEARTREESWPLQPQYSANKK